MFYELNFVVTAIATVGSDNKQDSSEVYDVQSITALSVLYNSEYINGEPLLLLISLINYGE